MLFESDYRFCTKTALRIMQEQRAKLLKDCLEYDPDIYNGLHSSDGSSLARLYYGKYMSSWINEHWEKMNDVLGNSSYPNGKKKEMVLFFAKYFAMILNVADESSALAKSSLPELLKQQQHALDELIHYSDKWGENNARLRVQMKKSKEQFKKKIEEAEKKL